MSDKVKLIIDTDPGVDDAMAIFYAAAATDIDLLGLTTIFGNVTVEMATRNALRLVEAAGLDVPVAAGEKTPLQLPPFKPSFHVHGDEGFGDIPAVTPKGKAIDEGAVDFLCRMAREHKGELVLCPIGPLTNIAKAIQQDPAFARNVKRIVLMGGSYREGGNITPHAEANIYHDPHAAEVVFASGARVEMVGLDVTHRILCTANDFRDIAAAAPKLGGMLQDMSHFYLAFYKSVGKLDGCSLHDPAAVIACTHPHLFTAENVGITVSCDGDKSGATQTAKDGRAPTAVYTAVEAAAVKGLFLEALARLS
ncbi:nucleoside hydrolase [Cognatishimia maritima]|uniref:Inosine-uridine nucleoside N-ribohydrolase n=1 Tax=Cognatishimia maritima TaxID=870908 RepID=A0A1M5K782_9RHOB|nr:nucleoside hydrolase [Cognatishimia maritima]SHG48369.1 Inosine-uridine nucleoside N-ribohydrolase [Cognatishimia maritima]